MLDSCDVIDTNLIKKNVSVLFDSCVALMLERVLLKAQILA